MRKMICLFLAVLLCAAMAVSAFALDNRGFLYDDANILTQSEEQELARKLADISTAHDAQIVIVTIPYLESGDTDSYVDYVYDSVGFGYGENRDGVLLLVCMDPREYRILSNGYPGVAIDTDIIGSIGDRIVPDLSEGYYLDAFETFADECAYYLDGYRNGFPFNASENLIICAIIGVVVGLVVVLVLRGQLKTVRSQSRAHDYVKDGSMQVNVMQDIYLYRNVTRTKKQTNNSSGSSGGSARSKGGGSF